MAAFALDIIRAVQLTTQQGNNLKPSALKLYRVHELTGPHGLLGISRTTLWRLVKDGEFPEPIKLSKSVTAWSSKTIASWIDEKSQSTTETSQK